MNNMELIHGLIDSVEKLPHRDKDKLDGVLRRCEMVIRNVFGVQSKYLKDLDQIDFFPMLYPADEAYFNDKWQSGKQELLNLLATIGEELSLFGTPSDSPTEPDTETSRPPSTGGDRQVFVVHGHDEAMKQTVARTLEKLHFDPIILHERENKGRTIMEKFSDLSDVSFAVVLLSADDLVVPKGDSQERRTRARQNVIFELGYFIGKLGRDKVVALYREDPQFEMPSDYSGVLFIPFDASGSWQFAMAKELKASGFGVDLNVLL